MKTGDLREQAFLIARSIKNKVELVFATNLEEDLRVVMDERLTVNEVNIVFTMFSKKMRNGKKVRLKRIQQQTRLIEVTSEGGVTRLETSNTKIRKLLKMPTTQDLTTVIEALLILREV